MGIGGCDKGSLSPPLSLHLLYAQASLLSTQRTYMDLSEATAGLLLRAVPPKSSYGPGGLWKSILLGFLSDGLWGTFSGTVLSVCPCKPPPDIGHPWDGR